jgi:hypothetical protein
MRTIACYANCLTIWLGRMSGHERSHVFGRIDPLPFVEICCSLSCVCDQVSDHESDCVYPRHHLFAHSDVNVNTHTRACTPTLVLCRA